jgi:hypothetical protein
MMALHYYQLKCSLALALLVPITMTLAAPITTTDLGSGSEEQLTITQPPMPIESANETANESSEEAGLGATPPNSADTTEATPAPPRARVALTFVTESPHAPYECSITSTTRDAEDSFRKGLSLVIDELQDRYLQVSSWEAGYI